MDALSPTEEPRIVNGRASLHCSQTLRRLAHELKREAQDWERKGHLKNYRDCRAESDRLWDRSKWYLNFARRS